MGVEFSDRTKAGGKDRRYVVGVRKEAVLSYVLTSLNVGLESILKKTITLLNLT